MSEISTTKKILLILIVFAFVFSSFYLLDFKAAWSETQANSGVSSYSSGSPKPDFSGRIHLYIEGNDALAVHLQEDLKEDLEAEGMDVMVVDTIEEKYNSQALLVNVSIDSWFYTPVYASSSLNLVFFYTSSGEDTKYFEQFKDGNRTVVFANTGSSQEKKLMDGEIKLEDTTKGLFSLKAYRKHLAEEVAGETLKQLLQQINVVS